MFCTNTSLDDLPWSEKAIQGNKDTTWELLFKLTRVLSFQGTCMSFVIFERPLLSKVWIVYFYLWQLISYHNKFSEEYIAII